jgi:non-ribosomal peptide synthetase component F
MQLGTGVANRGDPGVASTLGMLVNTIALRIDLSGDPSVREVLRRVRDAVIGGLSHADVPFDRVVDRLAPPRDPSRSLWCRRCSRSTTRRATAVEWPGLSVRVVHALPDDTAKADLNVIGAPLTDGVGRLRVGARGRLRRRDRLPDRRPPRAPARGVRRASRRAGAGAAARSARALRDAGAARPGGLAAGGGRSGPRRAHGDRRRTHRRDLGRPSGLTYADLWARAGGLAGALRAAGVAPGDRVGMALPRSADASSPTSRPHGPAR